MSYTLHWNKWDFESFENLSFQNLSDEELEETEMYREFVGDEFDTMEDFKYSDAYRELEDKYLPIYNYIHILSDKPSTDELSLIEELVPNVVIIYIEELDVYAIALTACGMDLSDCIELAYYIVDNKSPVKSNQIMSLSEKAKKLLLWCRTNRVYYDSIIKQLENGI